MAKIIVVYIIQINTSNAPINASIREEIPGFSRGCLTLDSTDEAFFVELPLSVTQANVKMVWKIQSAVVNTLAFVVYRPSFGDSSSTFIQSNIALPPNDFLEIEVKAQRPGIYVLQLKATPRYL
jgi:hypothetical protein